MKLTIKRARRGGEVLPEQLPEVLSTAVQTRCVIDHFTGYAPADTNVGLAEMQNLSPHKAPVLAVRRPREVWVGAVGSGKPHGMTLMNGQVYFVRGTTLYGPGNGGQPAVIGTVTDTDKIMVAFNGELLIFPDKVYLDRDTGTLKSMEIARVTCNNCQFTKNTIVLGSDKTWEGLGFRPGDSVTCYNTNGSDAAPAGSYRILSMSGRTATISTTFEVLMSRNMIMAREVPDFSTLCVSGERLYGAVDGEIYVSAAGSAFDWFGPDTDGKGPARLIAASEGSITACLPWQGYAIFFKEDRIIKLLGNRAVAYTLTDIPAPGIPAGMGKTLCEIGGALYYYGVSGIYRYTGSYPEAIGLPGDGAHLPGEEHPGYVGGVGGTDGISYYIALKTAANATRLFLYHPLLRRFYAEDDTYPAAMVTRRGFLGMQMADGRILLTASDGRTAGLASAESGAVTASARLVAMRPEDDGYWRPLRVTLRATGPTNGTLTLKAILSDGAAGLDAIPGRAVTVGQVSGAMVDRRVTFPLTAALCDAAVLILEMNGEWEVGEVALLCEKCR